MDQELTPRLYQDPDRAHIGPLWPNVRYEWRWTYEIGETIFFASTAQDLCDQVNAYFLAHGIPSSVGVVNDGEGILTTTGDAAWMALVDSLLTAEGVTSIHELSAPSRATLDAETDRRGREKWTRRHPKIQGVPHSRYVPIGERLGEITNVDFHGGPVITQ